MLRSHHIFSSILRQYAEKNKLRGTKLRWCAGDVDTEYSCGRHLIAMSRRTGGCFHELCQCKSVEEIHEIYCLL